MFGVLGKIFGTSDVTSKAIDSISDGVDAMFYTDEEKAENYKKLIELKSKVRIDELKAYHPYKLAQRVLAFSFVGVYLFVMMNGIIGSLYGLVDMNNVQDAIKFANSMYLGEITLTIVAFYFGSGAISGIVESRDVKEKKN